jgi:MerR family transcriptional regulator, heat shock protein HspR
VIINRKQGDPRTAPDQAMYGISVAAELSGAGVQSIRLWERRGLITPARTQGGTRRYSAEDVARIVRITALAAARINSAGITRILDLEDANTALRNARSTSLKSGVDRSTDRT